jgi:hypothetical protein
MSHNQNENDAPLGAAALIITAVFAFGGLIAVSVAAIVALFIQ